MLSNVNLENALGKHIGIYPIRNNSIEGASIDITASEYAWSFDTKKSIVNNNLIILEPYETAIIFSNEFVSLDNKYAGACYNRVSFSMKGIIHASSPLKPNYTGRLSISLYNASPEKMTISVGDPIAVVMFHKLDKKATITQGNGNGSRFDLLQAMNITVEDERTRTEITAYDDRDMLIRTMKNSDEFKEIRRRVKERQSKRFMPFKIFIVLFCLFWLILLLKGASMSIGNLILTTFISLVTSILGGMLVEIIKKNSNSG